MSSLRGSHSTLGASSAEGHRSGSGARVTVPAGLAAALPESPARLVKARAAEAASAGVTEGLPVLGAAGGALGAGEVPALALALASEAKRLLARAGGKREGLAGTGGWLGPAVAGAGEPSGAPPGVLGRVAAAPGGTGTGDGAGATSGAKLGCSRDAQAGLAWRLGALGASVAGVGGAEAAVRPCSNAVLGANEVSRPDWGSAIYRASAERAARLSGCVRYEKNLHTTP